MRSPNPRFRYLMLALFFLAELLLAISLLQALRLYRAHHPSAAGALPVTRIQTAMPALPPRGDAATTSITGTIPGQPTALLLWTATPTALPTTTPWPTATASTTPSTTPSSTPSATLSPTPSPLPSAHAILDPAAPHSHRGDQSTRGTDQRTHRDK